MHIAIMESDALSSHVLTFVARRRGHKAVSLDNGEGPPFAPSVLIVSPDRIGEDGLDRLERLRDRYPDSLLFITTEETDSRTPMLALQAGASDVIRKPYHPHEVILRAEVQLANRGLVVANANTATVGDLTIDLDAYSAEKAGRPLPLTKLEFRLLFCLAENQGRVTSIDRLLSFGWESMELPDASLLKTHVSHIRKKLRDARGLPLDIRSRHSLGYELRLSSNTSDEE